MTHDPLTEALESILNYVDIGIVDDHTKKIIKLILENLMLNAKIELLREINEGK